MVVYTSPPALACGATYAFTNCLFMSMSAGLGSIACSTLSLSFVSTSFVSNYVSSKFMLLEQFTSFVLDRVCFNNCSAPESPAYYISSDGGAIGSVHINLSTEVDLEARTSFCTVTGANTEFISHDYNISNSRGPTYASGIVLHPFPTVQSLKYYNIEHCGPGSPLGLQPHGTSITVQYINLLDNSNSYPLGFFYSSAGSCSISHSCFFGNALNTFSSSCTLADCTADFSYTGVTQVAATNSNPLEPIRCYAFATQTFTNSFLPLNRIATPVLLVVLLL